MPQMGSLVEQQGQLETLDRLMRRGLPPNLNVGLPQKVFRKNGAERGRRSRHATPPLPQQRIVSLLVGRLYGITCNLDIIYETEHLGVEQLKGFFIDFHWYQSSQGTLFSL